MFYTYILFCDEKYFYTGITNDLNRRLKEHQSQQCFSTKKYNSIRIIFFYEFDTRKKSRWLEKYIKNMGAKKFLKINMFK